MNNTQRLAWIKEVVARYRDVEVNTLDGGSSLGEKYLDILDELAVNMPDADARTSIQQVERALKEQ